MEAIRQIKVSKKNHKNKYNTAPDDFTADEVESDYSSKDRIMCRDPQWQMDKLEKELKIS
jgi:hypothetical protein